MNSRGNPKRQNVNWDEELKGFGLVVSRSTKTFVEQRCVDGRSVRKYLGEFPAITVVQARDLALDMVAKKRRGVNPHDEERRLRRERREAEWRCFTLSDALDEHVANMRSDNCADRSIDQMRDELERHCGDWLHRALVEIRRADCIDWHRELTAASGKYVANRVMRCVRACWNSARNRFEELPEHPVRLKWNKTKRRREPIAWDDLPAYWSAVDALANPIRRDLRVFLLLTGLRSEDARTVRWEHVDFEAGTIHRPKPKGGSDRAFTLPLSAFVLELLARRRMENRVHFGDDRGWAFPTRDRSGKVTHVREPKEQKTIRDADGKRRKVQVLPSPHRLRDTFATAGHEARVHPLDLKVLMNHSLPEGDVTEGYIRPSDDHLRVPGVDYRVSAWQGESRGGCDPPRIGVE